MLLQKFSSRICHPLIYLVLALLSASHGGTCADDAVYYRALLERPCWQQFRVGGGRPLLGRHLMVMNKQWKLLGLEFLECKRAKESLRF